MGSGAAAATATAPTPGTDTEKSFVCPTCSRVFNKKANLKVHSRKHTGEKPYACSKPGCGRAFMWKSSVTFHEQNCPAAKKDLNSNSTSSHSSLPPPLPSLKGVQKRPKPVAMSAATTVATNSSSPPRTRISPARDRSLLSVPTTSPSIASTPPSSSSTLLSAARRHTLAAVPGTPTTPEDPMPCPTVSQPLHFTLAPLPPPRPSSETPQPLFVPPHSMWGLMSSSPSPSVSSAQQAPPPTQAPTSQQPTSSTQEPSLRTVFGRPPLFHVPSRTDVPHTLPAPATLLQDDRTGASALRPPIPPVGAITLAGPFSKHLFPLHSANKDSRPSVLTTTNASTGSTTTPTTTTATTTTGGLNTGTVTLPSSHALVTSVSLVANTAVTPPTVTGGTTGNGGGFNTRLPPPPSAPAPSSAKPPTMPGVMPVNGGGGVSKMPKMPITMDLDDSDDETPMKIVGAQDAFIRSGNPFKGFAPPPRCSPLPVSSPIVCGVSPMPLSPLAPFSPLPPDSPAHHAPNPVHPPINQCVTRSTSMGW